MQFKVNWRLEGFREKLHEAGEFIEAELAEVEDLVKDGVLSIIGKKPDSPAPEVDINTLNDEELVTYAKDRYGYDLDSSLSREAKLTELISLKSGLADPDETPVTPSADGTTPVDEMTKAQLIAYAKDKHNVEINATLSKAAVKAEVLSLDQAAS